MQARMHDFATRPRRAKDSGMRRRGPGLFAILLVTALPATAYAGNGGTPVPTTSAPPSQNGGATIGQYKPVPKKAPAKKKVVPKKVARTKARTGLRVGSSGARVRYLQKLLATLGLDVPITSQFGPKTEAAVKSIQHAA